MNSETLSANRHAWADWPGWPYVLVGVAVVLRLAHIYTSRSNPTFWAPAVDPGWYDQTAQDILHGNWGPFPLFRAPLYPAFLAAVYGIFGHDLVAARVLNVAFQAPAVWVIWRVGRSYFSPMAGILAAALFALNGMAIFYAGEILSTSAETLAAALLMWVTLRLTRDRSPATLIVSGLAWGLAVITRPNFLFLYPIPVLAIWYLSEHPAAWTRETLLPKLAPIVIWIAAAFVPILPVTAVNWVKGGEPVLVATQGGVNFWIGNNPEATGILSSLPGYGYAWTMEDAQNAAEAEVGHKLTPGELSSYYYAKGWRFLTSNPIPSIRFMIRKTFLFFNQFEISNNKHIAYFAAISPWLPPLINLDFGVLIPLALLGAWVLYRRPTVKILIALVGIYALSVILFFVTSRFRMPAVPWLCILAAAGVVWAVEIIRSHPPRKALLPLALLVPGAVIAFMNPWGLEEAPVGWARYMEGNAFMKLGQLDSARVCFLDAVRDSMAVPRAKLNLGVIAAQQGKLTEARQWYLSSLADDSTNADTWNNVGTTYESLGDTNKAIEAYRQALALRPTAHDPRHNLAGVHFRQGIAALKRGDDVTAITQLEYCVELEPAAVAFYDLAIALGRSGNTGRALQSLDAALKLDPDFLQAHQLKEQILAGNAAFPKAGASPSDRDQAAGR